MALQTNLECNLLGVEIRVILKLGICRRIEVLVAVPLTHRLGVETSIRALRLKLLNLRLNGLSRLRLHERRVCRVHARVPRAQILLLGLATLFVHVVGLDELAFEENLEDAGVEDGTRCYWIVLVAKIVPFMPLIDEDPQIRRVRVQAMEELVQVASRARCRHIDDDVDALLGIVDLICLALFFPLTLSELLAVVDARQRVLHRLGQALRHLDRLIEASLRFLFERRYDSASPGCSSGAEPGLDLFLLALLLRLVKNGASVAAFVVGLLLL